MGVLDRRAVVRGAHDVVERSAGNVVVVLGVRRVDVHVDSPGIPALDPDRVGRAPVQLDLEPVNAALGVVRLVELVVLRDQLHRRGSADLDLLGVLHAASRLGGPHAESGYRREKRHYRLFHHLHVPFC